ncbi:amino acid adenylation domain-containing protein [Streptomyces sp. NPDC048290]|uniref:amino acid adenylation domain-containing protein n=1 Tax=Streptomyces sp. NPDC048290 TaxID=3155811 RepID=UPI00342863FB
MTESGNVTSSDRQELLRRRLARRTAAMAPRSVPRARRTEALLSLAQQRLWLDHLLDPTATRYNVPLRWWLHGQLDVGALRRAFEALIARHDVLRTVYEGEDVARQIVATSQSLDLTLTDLTEHADLTDGSTRGTKPGEAERRALDLSVEAINEPFDLAAGPVLRVRLYRTDADRWLLTVAVHHIAFDGWSMSVLHRELGALYSVLAVGEPDPLPALVTQYTDFAAQQRSDADSVRSKALVDHWRDRLSGVSRAGIPSDRERPDLPTGACAEHAISVPPQVVERLEALASEHDATLFMALLAAYHLLLFRYTGSPDVATGTPVGNRDTPAHEDLIGFFVNVIVLRSDLSGLLAEGTFGDLLDQMRSTALDGYAHSGASYDAVAEAVNAADRTPGATAPLFSSVFGLDTAPGNELDLSGLKVTECPVPNSTVLCDLAMSVIAEGGGLRCVLDYASELFDEATVTAFADSYLALLADIASGADRPLHAYAPASPEPVVLTDDCGAWAAALLLAAGAAAGSDPGQSAPATASAYVLDEHLRPVPRGAIGELYLVATSGARPDWAASELLPAPCEAVSPTHVYATGDRARVQGDGTLQHRGRPDGRVWHRGRLFDPEEIAHALGAHPAVRQAVAAAAAGLADDAVLIAHAVVDDPSQAVSDRIRKHLDGLLPLRPPYELRLWKDDLPVTADGRVDLETLALTTHPDGEATGEATPLQLLVAGIFAELLGVDRIDPAQDLRAAGADSLVSVRAVAQLRERLGRHIELRTLVKSRTAADVAAELGEDVSPLAHSTQVTAAADRLPLSPGQRSIWFLEKLRPGRTDYLMPIVWHLKGPLDGAALHRALDSVLARHAALRASFGEAGGQPVQHIAGAATVPWSIRDVGGLPPQEARAALRELAAEEAARPFDLGRPPLVRATLVRAAAEEHTLLVTVHHIVFDGWSTAVLLADLDTAYRDIVGGGTGVLQPPAVGYPDYVVDQERRLASPEIREQLQEWAKRLADTPPLELPRYGDEGLAQGGRHSLVLSRELTQEVRALANTESTTVFSVLFSAFNLLLGRLSAQEDVLLGVPFAGRGRPEFDELVGLFLNTLVVRTDLGGRPTFRSLLGRVSESLTEALSRQDLPFERLVEAINPPRDVDRNPLVDVLFNFANQAGRPTRCLGGLDVVEGDVGGSDPKFWLTLYGSLLNDRIHLEWVFRTDVFSTGQVTSMSVQFSHLLEQLTRRPDAPVATHSLRAPELQGTLPKPDEPLPSPGEPSVIKQFERMAQLYGSHPALTHGPVSRTYGELRTDVADLANEVARLTPEDAVVALSVPSSFGLAVGMLGVLAARRRLLVVDPALPRQRKELLLREAGARLVIGGSGGRNGSEDLDLVPRPLGSPGRESAVPLYRPGDRIAYLTFTSGSTGTPKCVAGSERGLAQFVSWQRETFGVGPGDRAAQLTALSFDVLYRDVLTPLVSGATLCIPNVDTSDPDRLFAWLRTEGVTLLHAVPSVARAWLSASYADRSVGTLRYVFFAGEPLPGVLVEEVRRRVANAEIVNLYGPTETTLAKLAHRVPPGVVHGSVAVGQPLPGCQALVLDNRGGLCSVGEPGEVVLRTPARSLGYVTASEEDHGRFFVSPFTGDPQDVLYRTGDQGRYRPDGSLELLGRLDSQLKLRGVRIEPGEIEAHLCGHPAVADAAVTVLEAEQGQGGEFAALVVLAGDEADAASLRAFLAERLPEYLIPGAFYRVNRIPVTASGKSDRRALHTIPRTRIESGRRHQPPRTPTESLLVDIWQQVLGLRELGVHDNFFERGGDSLRLVHATSLVREQGVELEVSDHYEYQTVAELAARVDRGADQGREPRTSPMVRLSGGGARPLFCVHPSGGSASWYMALARALPSHRPVTAFELPSAYGTGEPRATIEALAEEYLTHLLRTQPTGPYALMSWSYGGLIAFEMARRLTAAGHRVDPLILIEPTLPQDPASAEAHRTAAELYATAADLAEKAASAPGNSPERARLEAESADFFDSFGWGPGRSGLAAALPLRACGLLHEAYQAFRPGMFEGDLHLVLSREGREASPERPSTVLHDSAGRYIEGWRRLVAGDLQVHESGGDHMSMVAPSNAADLATLCERLCAQNDPQRQDQEIREPAAGVVTSRRQH